MYMCTYIHILTMRKLRFYVDVTTYACILYTDVMHVYYTQTLCMYIIHRRYACILYTDVSAHVRTFAYKKYNNNNIHSMLLISDET